jgi:hypothetical protein
MSDLERQIRELAEKTAQLRYQFLLAECQTCFTALDVAQFELSVGGITIAKREIAAVEKGLCTIERFLPEISVEQRQELEEKLAELKAVLALIVLELAGT